MSRRRNPFNMFDIGGDDQDPANFDWSSLFGAYGRASAHNYKAKAEYDARQEFLRRAAEQNAQSYARNSGNPHARYLSRVGIQELEVTEHVGLHPLQAYRLKRPPSADPLRSEMIVSTFLFDLYIKKPKFFWEFITNLSQYRNMYDRRDWRQLLSVLRIKTRYS